MLVGNPRCVTLMLLATEQRAHSQKGAIISDVQQKRGVSLVLEDCRSLASVSCLLGRKPCLSMVGDVESAWSWRPKRVKV